MESTWSEIKNTLYEINSRLDNAEQKLIDLIDIIKETIQRKQWEGKKNEQGLSKEMKI